MDSDKPAAGSTAMDALRNEILARIGGSEGNAEGLDATSGGSHALGSSLQPVQQPALDSSVGLASVPFLAGLSIEGVNVGPSGGGLGEDMLPPLTGRLSVEGGRQTLTTTRREFERMKQQFEQAQNAFTTAQPIGEDEVVIPLDNFEGLEAIRQSEEEARRLRRENAALKTSALCAEEESAERSAEMQKLVTQVGDLKAEMQDMKYRHQGEVAGLKQQLEDTMDLMKQNTEDLHRLRGVAREAEDNMSKTQFMVQAAELDSIAKQEQVSHLETSRIDMEQKMADLEVEKQELKQQLQAERQQLERTQSDYLQADQESREQSDRLRGELRAKDNELANLKQLLDDVMGSHVHRDELLKWKQRAEGFEMEYQKAMHLNLEVTTAVGQMNQASTERSSEILQMQTKNDELGKQLERKEREMGMIRLEKDDLQKQFENLEASCEYWQKKAKTLAADLKAVEQKGYGGYSQPPARQPQQEQPLLQQQQQQQQLNQRLRQVQQQQQQALLHEQTLLQHAASAAQQQMFMGQQQQRQQHSVSAYAKASMQPSPGQR
eukprot:TRINITY_DN59726_c0_g1_i1.p1 TRINITY_DN59726_c0_g1~~TRINITY_DN59726_c0_g1_i1.p1  ORF type:complete len:549 (-),score=161.02 TRINITY_DN59726_c0_g1_i1:133-1779(-)